MKRVFGLVVAVAVSHCLAAQAGVRDEVPLPLRGYWPAYGHTSQSITGDVVLRKSFIAFETGQRFKLSYVGRLTGVSYFENRRTVDVFRIRNPQDFVMRYHNRLCGEGAVTYLAIVLLKRDEMEKNAELGYMPFGDVLELTVITGAPLPNERMSASRFCADYNYQRRS